MKKKKVLGFKIGEFSLINQKLCNALESQLSEYKFEWFDVIDDIFRQRTDWYYPAACEAIVRYGRNMMSLRLPPKAFVPRTNIFTKQFRRWIAEKSQSNEVAFTLQTQSLFNAARPGVPHFIYTDHTYLANLRYPEPKPLLPVPSAWRDAERELYSSSIINFTSSEFAAKSIREDYSVPAEKVRCVHSGSNLEFPEHIDTSKRTGRKILFVGVDWERKGGPELLAAFRGLKADYANAELHIVGCEPQIAEATIHGRVAPEQVSAFMRECDIFCMPSRMEPSASVLVEAAAFALPVVTTRVGGSGERVIEGKTGFLTEPGDIQALSEALKKLLKDPHLRHEMGVNGRKLVAAQFTWSAVAKKMSEDIQASIGLAS